MKIKHLTHNEIDTLKWNACIQNARNPLVYAESWYLDMVSPNWEALISEDYEYVMPLPVKKKYEISFLVQPPLTQQLGIFSSHTVNENVIEHFIQKIPYRSYHLSFNEQNPYNKAVKQPNFVLNLNRDYDTISSEYSTNTKRNLKKTQQYGIEIKADLSVTDFLQFYNTTEKNYPVPPETKVSTLIKESFEKGKSTLYGAYNTNNELIATLCLLHSPQRLIFLLPVSNDEGKEKLAMFEIANEIIQKYANQNYLFDFYGSSVKNIARFYESFGANKRFYFETKRWSVNDLIKYFCFWK